jgi:hypothetical protein
VPIFSSLELVFSVTLLSPLTVLEAEAACGGAKPTLLYGINLFGPSRGGSFFNQIGGTNINNVGNTGFSLLSIGAIYL